MCRKRICNTQYYNSSTKSTFDKNSRLGHTKNRKKKVSEKNFGCLAVYLFDCYEKAVENTHKIMDWESICFMFFWFGKRIII